jgi:hypothetical protein
LSLRSYFSRRAASALVVLFCKSCIYSILRGPIGSTELKFLLKVLSTK